MFLYVINLYPNRNCVWMLIRNFFIFCLVFGNQLLYLARALSNLETEGSLHFLSKEDSLA